MCPPQLPGRAAWVMPVSCHASGREPFQRPEKTYGKIKVYRTHRACQAEQDFLPARGLRPAPPTGMTRMMPVISMISGWIAEWANITAGITRASRVRWLGVGGGAGRLSTRSSSPGRPGGSRRAVLWACNLRALLHFDIYSEILHATQRLTKSVIKSVRTCGPFSELDMHVMLLFFSNSWRAEAA